MEYQCDVVTMPVSDLYGMYKEGRLVKARIQRKKRWVDKRPKDKHKTNNEDFIRFIIKTGNTVNPLLLVERIDDNKKKNIIIDGNNRLNAIIDFIERPLKYVGEIMPNIYTEDVQKELANKTLPQLVDCRSFKVFCKNSNLMKYYVDNANNEVMDTEFDTMTDLLHSFKFMDIKVLIIRFENISEIKIKEIYEGVNCGGVKLTRQEILASTTSLIKYTRDEIELYPQLYKAVSEYYDEIDDNEIVRIERQNGHLTLFELLIGFQRYCSQRFSFISDVGEGDIDVIFKCYEIVFKNFDDKIDCMSMFFQKFLDASEIIKTIQDSFYNSNISHSCTDKYKLHLKKNAFTVIFTYIYKNLGILDKNELYNSSKKILFYNELCNMIRCKDTKTKFDGKNELGFVACSASGNLYYTVGTNIMNDKKTLKIPTDDMLRKILLLVNSEDVTNAECMPDQKPKKRGKLSKYKVLMLCVYFNRYVPVDVIHITKNIEHIVPWSVQEWSKPVNLDRLGNIVLIDENTNKLRSNKALTDRFIKEHKLYYYNYPCEMDYMSMKIENKKLGEVSAYTKICQEREQKYINCVLDSLKI